MGEPRIVARLRDGSERALVLDVLEGDAAHVFDELTAGRSQLLRGWVAVQPREGERQAVISGEEIVELQLIE
jgi:hypothetical protein